MLEVGFIKDVEEDTWLSLIVVVPKKNEKLRICLDFKKFNASTKTNPYSLSFTYEVINIVTKHEVIHFYMVFKDTIRLL